MSPDTNFVEITHDQFFNLLATSPCKLRKSWLGISGQRTPIWSLHEPADTVLGTPDEGLPLIALKCNAAYNTFFANKVFWAAYGLDLPDALSKSRLTNQKEKPCDSNQQ